VPGLFGIFELGRRSLLNAQTGMSNVGHNVANAATEGFHRQRVEFRAEPGSIDVFRATGNGARVDSVRRVENRFLENALDHELPVLSRFTARAGILSQSELIFGEPSDEGITTVLDRFFDGWNELASNPESSGGRESVVRLGAALASSLSSARRTLLERQNEIDIEIDATLEDAHRSIHELKQLNQEILKGSAAGIASPDLADRRDHLVETLGELLGASATIEESGTATLRLNGRVLLQRESIETLSFERGISSLPRLSGGSLAPGEIDGRLGGLLDARDHDLAPTLERLDEFALRLAQDVNAIHEQGLDSHGSKAQSFFVLEGLGPDGVEGAAGGIRVNEALARDSSLVSAGGTEAPGDNSTALELASLRSSPSGLTAMLRDLVGEFGARSREAQDAALGSQILVDSLRAQREAISGVSLDEEAADLLRFERMYQAAARIMTMADEMAQMVLSM
jgi:flagellar hook-associated protein 1 FlgK